MNFTERTAHLTIWAFAFGYFAFYVPYSASVKGVSKNLWPGMDGPLSRLEILPGFMLGAALVVLAFITITGWWRYVPRREVMGMNLPWPNLLPALSGIGTASLITATTLAYTFHGISIVFALLLMRGGVLIMAPILDALFKRDVAWNSWAGLGLSLVAVGIALADQDSYILSVAAVINLAFYYGGYAIRLQCITSAAKSEVPDAKFRFFAQEQTVSMLLLLIMCAGLTLYGATIPTGAAAPTMFTLPTLVIGFLYGCLFLFGSMIYMDARENCFCIPINRCSSVIAGLVATTGMYLFLDQAPVTGMQLVATAFILLAILSLAAPSLFKSSPAAQKQAQRLVLFVCDSNVSRSPIAESICRSELAKQLAAGQGPELAVTSAGLNAKPNAPMSPNAVKALEGLNVPSPAHSSRQLDAALVAQSDQIFCMTERQKSDLLAAHPEAAGKVACLDARREIANPSGGTVEDYLACSKHIRSSVLARLGEIFGTKSTQGRVGLQEQPA